MIFSKTFAGLVVSLLALSACGERPPEKKSITQIAARVNSREVTTHQINYVLQRSPAIQASQLEVAKQQILESLVDQELAVQQALEENLDRTPGVTEAIEAARREVLARSYFEKVTLNQSKPSTDEVQAYFTEHPELFANRKIYRLEEINFSATVELLANIKEQLAKGKNTPDIMTLLNANGIEATSNITVKPAEQIPLEYLPNLVKAKLGRPEIFESGAQIAIITVLATKSDPLDQIKAQPFIEIFLSNKQKAELIRDTIKQLRAKAKIEYLDEFSKDATRFGSDKAASASNEASANKGVAGPK